VSADSTGRPPTDVSAVVELPAPAKLTLSLKIVGVRRDGFHRLESEMVSVDLADTLKVRKGDRLGVTVATVDASSRVEDEDEASGRSVPVGPDNLVSRALRAVGRKAHVELVKRVPPGAGLGGGSADAAAILRWAGCHDVGVALSLGADVPFCVTGGRAVVRGVGEDIESLPYEERVFTLLLLPFGMDTAAVYRAWDRMAPTGRPGAEGHRDNDLEVAAQQVDGRLALWKETLAQASGRVPRLAGSGSTWFVEGTSAELGLADRFLHRGRERARLVEVRTVPGLT
jgi:4-diphosphocytidyl-2-C-methyl-D-erythritol kinase